MLRSCATVLLACASAGGLAAPVPKEDAVARLRLIYGTPYEFNTLDHFAPDGDKLRVFVGLTGETPSDDSRLTSPRVWRDVKGDFTFSVRVSFPLRPDQLPFRIDSRAGGLVAWAGESDFVVLRRDGSGGGVWHTCVEARGIRSRGGTNATPSSSPLYLRLRRERGTVTCGHSTDGKNWNEFTPDTVEWGDTVKVGVHVKSRPGEPYESVFDEYKLTVPKK